MKIFVLVFCLTLAAVACRAGDYHLIQSQVADEVPMHGPVDSATVYVLLCPDQRVYVFRKFDSHEMETRVSYLPHGSVLHYDGNAFGKQPEQAQILAFMALCKSKGIVFEITPLN